jgi:hypothetical protein
MNYQEATTMAQKYPKVSLEQALGVAQAVYKQNKHSKISTLATAMGYQPTTGIFRIKKAAAKMFGLIQEEGDVVTTTKLSIKILSPYNESERLKSLQLAFNSFDIFNELYERIPVDVQINSDRIATLAERECEIHVENKEDFVDVFVSSAVFANLLEKVNDNSFIKYIGDNAQADNEDIPVNSSSPEVAGTPVPSVAATHIGQQIPVKAHDPSLTLNINLNIDSSTSIEVIEALFNKLKTLRE